MTDPPPVILEQLAAIRKEARSYLRKRWWWLRRRKDEVELIALLFRYQINGIVSGQESVEKHLQKGTQRRLGLEAKGCPHRRGR